MQLSSLSLKYVLQHLEPNLRIQLAVQSPTLKKFDETCPLRIQKVYWDDKCLKINRTLYTAIFCGPAEPEPKRIKKNSGQNYFLIELGGRTERVAYNRTEKEVMDYLVKKLLGQRKVLVQQTSIAMDNEAFQNLEHLHTGSLEISTPDIHKFLDTLTSIFHPSTFPLKSLDIPSLDNYEHRIIQTAQLLVIPNSRSMHLISNKRVHARDLKGESFIEYWLKHGKEIGTHFSAGEFSTENDVFWKYQAIFKLFEEKVSRRASTPPSFGLKIDNLSEIAIDYGLDKDVWRLNFKVKKRIV